MLEFPSHLAYLEIGQFHNFLRCFLFKCLTPIKALKDTKHITHQNTLASPNTPKQPSNTTLNIPQTPKEFLVPKAYGATSVSYTHLTLPTTPYV